ncbi:MAG: phosphoenolpyruvate--protein phosphotransferase [Candidatus Eiseniibacteriota bacterium]
MKSESLVLRGRPISAGVAVGVAEIRLEDPSIVPVYRLTDDAEVEREIEAFAGAVREAEREAETDVAWAKGNLPESEVEIFAAQRAIFRDPSLAQWVKDRIRTERINAAAAVRARFDEFRAILRESSSELIRNRILDVTDAEGLILSCLLGQPSVRDSMEPGSGPPLILVTDDPPPSLLARINPERVVGILCEQGAGMGHVAVLARALNLPAVIQVPELLARTRDGDTLAVDGDAGCVTINPAEADLEELRARERRRHMMSPRPADPRAQRRTADGRRIYLLGNATSQREVDAAAQVDADGIGLYRTEYLYLAGTTLPAEADLVQAYSEAARSFVQDPIDVRLLDLGSDRRLTAVTQPPERNPALGLRSLRFLFENPAILQTQIRAVLQAASEGPIRLLLPMVTGPGDVRRVREVVEACHEELRREGLRHDPDLRVGAMIESPAGALLAEDILVEVDFLSVGSNDLTMYLLAVDRDAPHLSEYYDPFHPAVLRTLRNLAKLCRSREKQLSLCGEIAGDPTLTALLVGLGFERFSMNPQWIVPVGHVLSSVDASAWSRLAEDLLLCDSAAEIRRRVRETQAEVRG